MVSFKVQDRGTAVARGDVEVELPFRSVGGGVGGGVEIQVHSQASKDSLYSGLEGSDSNY